MKIAVIGAAGQLGSDICKLIAPGDLIPLTHKDIEITDIASVEAALAPNKPEVVINTAAYVRVDDCESNVDEAYRVNTIGARNVAVISQQLGAVLAHLSTDYVFGGDANRKTPYNEFDDPAPINVYGHSISRGEESVRLFCNRHFIVRTSSLFGIAGSASKGGNFVETILKQAAAGKEIRVVDDQVMCPTYSRDLAAKLLTIIATKYYGTFHVTNWNSCTWFEFAREILAASGMKTNLTAVHSSDYPTKAKRPSYSVLDNYQLRLLNMGQMPHWDKALRDYLKDRKSA
jgi:dTDP-4-dehydrorhamnose reductase